MISGLSVFTNITWIGAAAHAGGIMVCLATAVGAYATVFADLSARNQHQELERQQLESAWRDAPRRRCEYEELRKELAGCEQVQREVVHRIPEKPHEADFLSQVAELASRSGLKIGSYNPGTIRNRPEWSEIEISLVMQGDYVSICRFVDGLAKLPRLSNIEKMEITANAEHNLHAMAIKLVIYFDAKMGGTSGIGKPTPQRAASPRDRFSHLRLSRDGQCEGIPS